jgi:queuine/archaeosine tRNA-ribosyltransferase
VNSFPCPRLLDSPTDAVKRGTIVAVHNLRNRFVLAEHGLEAVPLMVSAADILARPYLLRTVKEKGIKGLLGAKGPLFVDSGGFSVLPANRQVEVAELAGLYRSLDADVLAALDQPPARTDSEEDRAGKWRITLEHLDRLLTMLDDPRLMPIIHGRTLSEIDEACQGVKRRVPQPRFVALGGMVPFLRGHMQRGGFQYFRQSGDLAGGPLFVADALVLLCQFRS